MFRAVWRGFLFCVLMAAVPGVSLAQSFVLDLPLPSQRAEDWDYRYHNHLSPAAGEGPQDLGRPCSVR
jgi:hypothetical protein